MPRARYSITFNTESEHRELALVHCIAIFCNARL
jgi:hypothetical protein